MSHGKNTWFYTSYSELRENFNDESYENVRKQNKYRGEDFLYQGKASDDRQRLGFIIWRGDKTSE